MELKQGAEIIPLPLKKGGTSISILSLVKKRVDDKTEFLMDGLTTNIADALFDEMRDLDEQEALTHHFNIMRTMKVGEEVYQTEFADLMHLCWLGFLKKMDESHLDELEEDVVPTIKQLSDRVSNHYKVLLLETRLRFQTLLKREIDRHPLCPDLFYRCFWQALKELDLTYGERVCVLTLFNRFVMDRYGQILAQVNRTLIELKVDTSSFDN